ncbi:thioredoxin family protein [Solitalea koreensis]|uniref:Thioredoxin-related protein n=1 Tax=Solitalea koreensis TaxID=543615 RepID=A0A521AZC2_9SPHI|nr:thioredoxin family protein [Solitalea koreensis]SMO39860.1 Thioredoxin-related protein [Solitalea koreensis]
MKKSLLIIIMMLLIATVLRAQEAPKVYNPAADAKADLKAAIAKAQKERKHVFLQIGGNWCSWCIRFNKMVTEDSQLDSALKANYVVYHLNYSKENKNEDVLASLGYPQRFGFPVFVILDAKGNRLNTQNSAYLEQDKGYSKAKVLEFFKQWSPAALDPKSYQISK